jgi:hypothetical protein
MLCTFCGSKKHSDNNCPKTPDGQANRAKLKCSYCGSTTHKKVACAKTTAGNTNLKWHLEIIEDDIVFD